MVDLTATADIIRAAGPEGMTLTEYMEAAKGLAHPGHLEWATLIMEKYGWIEIDIPADPDGEKRYRPTHVTAETALLHACSEVTRIMAEIERACENDASDEKVARLFGDVSLHSDNVWSYQAKTLPELAAKLEAVIAVDREWLADLNDIVSNDDRECCPNQAIQASFIVDVVDLLRQQAR